MSEICSYENCGRFFLPQNGWRNSMAEDKKKDEIAVIEINEEFMKQKLYEFRGCKVLLDADLAEVYGYELKAFNQQVKRNIERFPEDFMFRLSNGEIDSVRSQIVTSRKKDFLLDRKADVDIYHTHLQSKEFICLQQFFVEN